jgi:hypothetical protein
MYIWRVMKFHLVVRQRRHAVYRRLAEPHLGEEDSIKSGFNPENTVIGLGLIPKIQQ